MSQNRQNCIAVTAEENEFASSEAISPILSEGDAIGAVVLLNKDTRIRMGDTEKTLTRCAAGFLGRQMES